MNLRILTWILFLGSAKCTIAGFVKCKENEPLWGSFGYFEIKHSRFQSQQVLLLTEFSRFMNKQAPRILKDFVDQKKMYQAEKTLKKLKRFNNYFDKFAPPTSSIDITPEKKSNSTMESYLKTTFEAVRMAKYITHAAERSTLKFEHFAWETACFSEWWPFDDDTCAELRCTACAPAIMSARAVCSKQSKESFSCLQKTMSEGYCNFCIADYIEQPEK